MVAKKSKSELCKEDRVRIYFKDKLDAILEKNILVAGCGSLGSSLTLQLASCGFKKFILVDFDLVEKRNLSTQQYFLSQLGTYKVDALKEILEKKFEKISCKAVKVNLNEKNVEEIIKKADVVVDGLDNFATRFALSDACRKLKIPYIFAACAGSFGITGVFYPSGICLRCFLKDKQNWLSCAEVGVAPQTVAITASLESMQVIYCLLGVKQPFYYFDLNQKTIDKLKLSRTKCKC
ncbi:MAG: HesA/MoeB/ThiF family protein [archaeon]